MRRLFVIDDLCEIYETAWARERCFYTYNHLEKPVFHLSQAEKNLRAESPSLSFATLMKIINQMKTGESQSCR